MNRDKVKKILSLFRAGGPDREEAEFVEALAATKTDGELAKWFAEQQAFDALASSSLNQVPVPDYLKNDLLREGLAVLDANQQVSETWLDRFSNLLNAPVFSETRVLNSRLWQQRRLVAFATVFLGFAIVTSIVGSSYRNDTFANYRQEIVEKSYSIPTHVGLMTSNLDQVRNWLASKGAPSEFVLPEALSEAHVRGCGALDWQGHKVGFVCFLNDIGHFHLLVSNSDLHRDGPMANSPELQTCGGWKTASWTQGKNSYVFSGMNYSTFVKLFRKDRKWNFDL